MRVVKPQQLALLTRCFEYRRKYFCGVAVIGFVPLADESTLFSEAAMWTTVAEQMGEDAMLDAGMPKRRGEFLVAGQAYPPGAERRSSCRVSACLDKREKVLNVFGDRYFSGNHITDPVPFDAMPLAWTHAFGGEGFKKNPVGRGAAAIRNERGEKVHPLPNLEYPDAMIGLRGQVAEPACFGAVDLSWPQRSKKAGTYDQAWLKEHFPGLAPDIDWSFFNLASEDQQFDSVLRGDETYRLEGMHPEEVVLEGRLPGFRARCFLRRAESDAAEELSCHLTTVWFLPEVKRAVLVYHGCIEVDEEDAADIEVLMIAAERLEENKGEAHYRRVLERRLDKERGPMEALRDADLLPEGLDSADAMTAEKAIAEAGEGLLRKNLRSRTADELKDGRKRVADYGLDPEEHGPPEMNAEEGELPTLDTLEEFVETSRREAKELQEQADAGQAERDAALAEILEAHGMDIETFKAEAKETAKGPPSFTVAGQKAELENLIEQMESQGADAGELHDYLDDPKMNEIWAFSEREQRKAYRRMAHFQTPADSAQDTGSERERLARALSAGKSLDGVDFTGADLSEMDLSGAELGGIFLESANLFGTNFVGANLDFAVLAHANLQGACMDRASLVEANLGNAQLKDASLKDADLNGAILARARLTDADLSGAQLAGADLAQAVFENTDFSRVRTDHIVFLDSDMQGTSFREAELEQAAFLKVDLDGTDFSGAQLHQSVFLGVTAHEATFERARMENVRFVQECDLSGSRFNEARVENANLRGSRLADCDFSRVHLNGSDLSESRAHGACFHQAVAANSQWVRSDLREANLSGANLMAANLQRADIRAASLRGSNLYQSDLARVHVDRTTDFDSALTHKMRTYPRRFPS